METLNELIDRAIEVRKTTLTTQIEMLDAILLELKRENPNMNICLRGIGITRDYIKMQLDGPDNLTCMKKIIEIMSSHWQMK